MFSKLTKWMRLPWKTFSQGWTYFPFNVKCFPDYRKCFQVFSAIFKPMLDVCNFLFGDRKVGTSTIDPLPAQPTSVPIGFRQWSLTFSAGDQTAIIAASTIMFGHVLQSPSNSLNYLFITICIEFPCCLTFVFFNNDCVLPHPLES